MEGAFLVCAGWLEGNPVIGKLNIAYAHGRESMAFSYDAAWIERYSGLLLDPELMPYTGLQYPSEGKTCFGFLSDAAPDRWGRKLMDRREVITARNEKRRIRKLYDGDYLLGVHDRGRMGGLRFCKESSYPDGIFLSDIGEFAVPPVTELRRLENASWGYEAEKDPYEDKWIRDLIDPGSSLGGARPKANVVDPKGNIWIAKFPSRHDTIDIGAWEMVTHDLAVQTGINVPEAKLVRFSDNGGTFLTKRFDRRSEKREIHACPAAACRIHFASAMTMLSKTDGTSASSSYLDIAEVIEEISAAATGDLQQLWKRIVFSILVGNADDHLRNHGFVLQKDGWHLSPAFDINPVYNAQYLSLMINESDNTRDLRLASEIAEYFRITNKEAQNIIHSMSRIVSSGWRNTAKYYHIPAEQQDLMSQAFSAACEW